MTTLNSIVYYDFVDELFTCQSVEINEMAIGKNPEQAVKNLVKRLEPVLEEITSKDNNVKSFRPAPKHILFYFEKVMQNLDKYDLLTESIKNGYDLNAYVLK